MREFILNETEWMNEMLERMELGPRPWYTLSVYVKCLSKAGLTKTEVRRKVELFIKGCNSAANIDGWQSAIDSIIKVAYGKPPVDVGCVSITRAEIEWIGQRPTVAQRKLLFTLLCVSKLCDALREQNNGWTNTDISDLFKLANVVLNKRRCGKLLNELMQDGCVAFSKRVNNTNIRVINPCDVSEVALVVSDFRNLGNQYMNHVGDGYIMCAECGLVIKKSGRRHRYCKECAEKMNRMNTLANYNKTAENENF